MPARPTTAGRAEDVAGLNDPAHSWTAVRRQRGVSLDHPRVMALSMRTLLATDTRIPATVRAGIANGDPESAGHLMTLGLNECEAAELLDEPCGVAQGTAGEPRHSC